MALIWLLLGCEPTAYDDGPDVFSAPVPHDGDAWLFDVGRISRIDVELDDDALEILRAEHLTDYPRSKVRGQVVVDGESVGDVGVRLRGALGSFTSIDEKPKLELDFNEFSGERFHGLESLMLNNMREDCTSVREVAAYAAYAHAGVPTPRTGYAQVFVNGQDYGLYLVLEAEDDRFLKRTFSDRGGRLYDGKYAWGGFMLKTLDFDRGRDDWFDLEEGEPNDWLDIKRVSAEVANARETGVMGPDLWDDVDWERLIRQFVVEDFVGNEDGYLSFTNNYRLYFQPHGSMVMIPWDADATFVLSEQGQMIEPELEFNGALAEVCDADPDCRARWDQLHVSVTADLLDGTVLAETQAAVDTIGDAVLGDPRRDCNQGDVADQQSILEYLATGDRVAGVERQDDEEGCSTGAAPAGRVAALAVLGILALRRRQEE
jgi:MYXO-CTERM domain-containing protein